MVFGECSVLAETGGSDLIAAEKRRRSHLNPERHRV